MQKRNKWKEEKLQYQSKEIQITISQAHKNELAPEKAEGTVYYPDSKCWMNEIKNNIGNFSGTLLNQQHPPYLRKNLTTN